MSQHVVLSFGLGIDSTGILVRWLTDPSSRDFPLSALTVLVSQLGDEYPDTYRDLNQVILPMLHRHRVRLVQVARPALSIARGGPRYVVLDDRTSDHRLVRRGPVRYSDELRRNGTIPQLSNRRCSLRWKGEVLDAWIADNMPPGFTHVLGYDAGEQTRSHRDAGIIRHGRRPDYPLQRWGWHRDTTRQFLHDVTGRWFNRSCCAQCPFQTEWASRWRSHPQSGADALLLEYTALALNPRMRLFGRHSAWSLASGHQLDEVIAAARARIAAAPWAGYEVRRTFSRPNAALRSVRTLTVGTRAAVRAAVAATTARHLDTDPLGVVRAWLRPATSGYPRAEHLIVAAPAGVADKERPAFARTWNALQPTSDAIDSDAAYCTVTG